MTSAAHVIRKFQELRAVSLSGSYYQRGVIHAVLSSDAEQLAHYTGDRDQAFKNEAALLYEIVELIYNMPADQKNDLIDTLRREIILWNDLFLGFDPKTQAGPRSSKLFSDLLMPNSGSKMKKPD